MGGGIEGVGDGGEWGGGGLRLRSWCRVVGRV